MIKKLIVKSILAGILIGIAACIYMSCDNKYIGALLFSLGLCAVLILEANLFTGKIGYVNSGKKFLLSNLILVFNLIFAYLIGLLYKVCIGNPVQNVGARFINFIWYAVLFKGFITGICIYLAVEMYKKTNSVIPVILGVAGFILSGSYHCIADACYLGASTFSWSSLLYILLVIVGNSLGSLLIRVLQVGLLNKRKENN